MDFRILGPLEVRDRGRPIELRRPKQRALLALLLLRTGEIVSSDTLIDGLWGEEPPRTARAALQNYVAQLRRALGPEVVLSRPGGYLLDVAPEQVDLRRFERLSSEGRAASGQERVEKLREAVALWRGLPLEDFLFEPFAAVEAGRLDELRTAAFEDLIDAELSAGAGAELVGEIESLIAKNPFRERLRGQLMLALYRAGRQAEALEAYQETRRTLDEELGIEPSAALRELEQAILRQESSLVPPAPTQVAAPPEPRRKTVTVLFADLTFAETLDPELLRATTASVLMKVRGVLRDHGASIEQRAGEEVMAVFGVPVAHEDDVLRAARAGLELQVEVGTLAQALWGEGRGSIELRVGIETGEILAGADEAGHGFIAGAAISLARRLQQAALPGEILAGTSTLRLLGDAVLAETADGKRQGAYRLLEVVHGVPALARHLEAPLGDREAELAALREAFGSVVTEGRCHVRLILGEPGIGKTRLVNEFAVELGSAASVLVGRCVSYGKGATFLPLAEIIEQAARRFELPALLAPDEDRELIGSKLAEITGEREPSGFSGEGFWAARRLFEALATESPLVLVLEDLHWAESTLLELIDYLAESASGAPILVLAIARPELLEEKPEWRRAETLTLAPLPGPDAEALIDNLAEVPRDLRARIARTAGGNPLFIEQLLAYAAEDMELERIPPSLESLLASRLDRLEAGQLSILQRAAVAGREFSRDAVVHLTPEDHAAAVGEHLLALVRAELIRPTHLAGTPEQTFRFHHVLIRDAAYNSIPKNLRSELHERAADWLDMQSSGHDELVGYHLEQAYRSRVDPGPPDARTRRLAADGGKRLAAAGLRAAKSGDAHAAANLLTRATSLLDEKEIARRDLLTELGLVLWRGGNLQRVEQVFTQALEAAVRERDRRAELRARLELANLRLTRAPEGGADELLALAAEAIPALKELGDDRTLGRTWYVLAFVHGGLHCQYRESAEAAERALRYFRRSRWPVAPCLQEIAVSLYFGPTTVREGIRRCRGLLDEADRGGEANVLVFLAGLEALTGRFDSARSVAARAQKIYEELAWADKIAANYSAIAADIELLAGNYTEAEDLLRDSCARLEAWDEQAHLATQAAQLGEALYCQGRFEDALRWSEVAKRYAATDDASAQFSWHALRAKALAHKGALGEADTLARTAVEIAAATDAVNQHAHVLLGFAEVLRLEGKRQRAAEAIKDAIRLLEGKGNVASSRKAHSLLGELGGT